MGQRGELFTRKVFTEEGEKTYFFNIKENRYGDLFLNLAESRKMENEHFERRSLMIYREDMSSFKETFYKSIQLFNQPNYTGDPIGFTTESGRRTYRFVPVRFKQVKFLQIEEIRIDQDLQEHKEAIRVEPEHEESFLNAFRSALRFMENSQRKMVVKLSRTKEKKRTRRRVTLKKSD